MISFFGVVLFVLGAFGVLAGMSLEDNAQSAFHQTYAAIVYSGGAVVASLGIITCALGVIASRLKLIDEALRTKKAEPSAEPKQAA